MDYIINLYLDYVNNFASIYKFAERYGLDDDDDLHDVSNICFNMMYDLNII